jgi:GT2 family glycosyltransferase
MRDAEISVVVCAYTEQRWGEMLACVASLKRQTLPPREIILVIDHNPALFERSRQHFSGVRVIENREARGLSGARNSGIAAAQGAIIAFMDEDATADPHWLETLASGYTDERVMGVGGEIVPMWSTVRPDWFPEEFDWVVGCTYRGMPTSPAPVRNLIGCNMSFRREISDVNGGFRDGIGRIGSKPVGCEETEYCIRASQRFPQKHFLYHPAAKVYHYVPENRGTWGYFRSRCYAEGQSKALIGRYVGRGSGLSTETSYATRTLPLGVLRALRQRKVRRAGAIVAGLLLTTHRVTPTLEVQDKPEQALENSTTLPETEMQPSKKGLASPSPYENVSLTLDTPRSGNEGWQWQMK